MTAAAFHPSFSKQVIHMSTVQETLALKDPSLFRQQAYVNGEWQGATNGETFEVRNPATGGLLGTVPAMGTAETRHAIEAANAAYRRGARRPRRNARSSCVWHDLMMENADDLALILTTEQGKSLAEAKGEIGYAASFLEWFAEEGKRVYGDTIPTPASDKRIVVTKEAIGVCAAITPWNFPAAMITRKVGPALAAGCPIVVKPAEATPFSALAMAVLAERAGAGGRVQRRHGRPEGDRRRTDVEPDRAQAVVHRLDAGRPPADVAMRGDGQEGVAGARRQRTVHRVRRRRPRCGRAGRDRIEVPQQRPDLRVHEPFYVHEAVYDQFAQKLAAAVGQLKVGRGTEPGVTQGPLINEAAVLKVEAHIEDALAKGATVVTGGKRHALGHGFFEPTVLTVSRRR